MLPTTVMYKSVTITVVIFSYVLFAKCKDVTIASRNVNPRDARPTYMKKDTIIIKRSMED
ncbi:hypothetical protein PUN28_011139 [Cardiocondyla obscurior]|uniref:Uncharacterized protein n=1 Tax=Cardiocondyla obscurior TaxID=286306 RepID=A0AAW2FKY4_9HYME